MHISNQTKALNYLGSKFSLLPWLLPLLPYTHSWVDLFGGGGNVTCNRLLSPIETFNDINQKVFIFFKVLREQPAELLRLLELTPHSRQEYERAWYTAEDTELESARKFFIRTAQSFFSSGIQNELKGWLSSTKESRRSISQATHKWLSGVETLRYVTERFRRVQLECRDFGWVLKAYDTPETLFYADPPYDEEFRSGRNDYEYDFTPEDHKRLHDAGLDIKGKIAVSGYDSEFMRDLYKDYFFNPGPKRRNTYSTKNVREALWTNYDPAESKSGKLFR